MAEIQQGAVAIVHGLPDTDIKVNGAGSASAWIVEEVQVTKAADKYETRDEAGEIVNIATYNQNTQITITVFPASSSKANAHTANVLPTPGGYLNLISASGTADGDYEAVSAGTAYRIDEARKTRTQTGKVGFVLTLQRVAGISTYTALS